MPAGKQADSTKDPEDPNFRFYKPTHPNGKTSGHPKRGWCWPRNPHPLQPHRPSFSALDADNRIVWGDTQKKVPQLKKFLHEVDTQVAKSVVLDYTDGEKQLTKSVRCNQHISQPEAHHTYFPVRPSDDRRARVGHGFLQRLRHSGTRCCRSASTLTGFAAASFS